MAASAPAPTSAIEVFFSYAHEDEALRDALATHLRLLERQGIIAGWHDRRILPGGAWAGAIDDHLQRARIILLLVSADFLASDYSYDVEVQQAMARHDAGAARVIPVILRPVDWHSAPFGTLQALPKDGHPVTSWSNRDEAFAGRGPRHPRGGGGVGPPPFAAPPGRPNPSPVGLPAVWNVPYARNPAFTGREDLLDALYAARTATQPVALTQVLRGLGGVGKTQLALEYAYRCAHAFQVIWWLRAEEPATLAADYAALAEPLSLPAGVTPEPGAQVAAVRAWLEGHDGWLLVFDNAPEPAAVTPYLPRRGGGQVLITSRYLGWGGTARSVTVQTFPRDESVRFLLDRTQQADADAATALAAEVGDLPIALAQVAGYIDATGITLAGYLSRWRTHQAELMRRGHEGLDYPATVATTWEVAFQALQAREPAAADLLCLCAYLAPEAIPQSLLRDAREDLPERLAAAVADDLAWDAVIAALRRYALVETAEPTLAVHRLVQAVTRDRLTEDARRTWAAAAVTCLARAMPQGETPPWDVRTWPTYAQLLPHGLAAAAHAEALQVAREDTAFVLNQLGLYLQRPRAVDRRAGGPGTGLDDRRSGLRPRPPRPWPSRVNNLGSVLRDLGDLAGARAAFERALTIDEAAYGPDHPTWPPTSTTWGVCCRTSATWPGRGPPMSAPYGSSKSTWARRTRPHRRRNVTWKRWRRASPTPHDARKDPRTRRGLRFGDGDQLDRRLSEPWPLAPQRVARPFPAVMAVRVGERWLWRTPTLPLLRAFAPRRQSLWRGARWDAPQCLPAHGEAPAAVCISIT